MKTELERVYDEYMKTINVWILETNARIAQMEVYQKLSTMSFAEWCVLQKKNVKTSEQWYSEIPKELKFKILDPDGWDRSNYQYSWYEELITLEEFKKRLMPSTIMASKAGLDWIGEWVSDK